MSLKKRCDCAKPAKCEHAWHYDFRVEGRRFRDSTKTADRKLALDIEALERARALKSAHGIKSNANMTLASFWPLYVERHAKLQQRASTLERNERIWRVNVLPALGGRLLGEITSETLGGYAAKRLTQGAEPGTINRELALVSGMLAKAVEWGYLLAKPRTPSLPLRNERTRVLSAEELERLFAYLEADPYLRAHYYAPIRLLLITGAREREVLDLTWEDWVPGETLALHNADGRTKTDDAPRVLPTTPEIDALLGRLPRISPYLFPSPKKPEQPISSSGFLHAFQAACAQVGIKGVTVHTLRHTAATRMLVEQRVDPRTVQEVLGWKTLKMLQRYTHPSMDAKRRALSGHSTVTPLPASGANYSSRTELGPPRISRNHAGPPVCKSAFFEEIEGKSLPLLVTSLLKLGKTSTRSAT